MPDRPPNPARPAPPAPPVRVVTQTVLDRYLARGQLGGEGQGEGARRFRAGMRLYADWRASGLQPSVVGRYAERTDRGGGGGGGEDPAAHRYIAFRRALRATGDQLSPLLIHVVLHDRPAGEWAAARRYAAQAAMPILHLALDALAAHYGMD